MMLVLKVPAILLGAPIPGSENPYIAAPTGSARFRIELEDCSAPSLRSSGLEDIAGDLREHWVNTVEGLGAGICSRLELEGVEGSYTRAGLYAAATIGLMHALSRHHGESLSSMELVELARYGDPYYRDVWGFMLDALRYSVAEGGLVVYRNDEEHSRLADTMVKAGNRGVVELSRRVDSEKVGSDVYSGLIHLMGVTVLEASLRIGEGMDPVEVLRSMAPIHEGVMMAVWGYGRSDDCITSPSMPGTAEVLCPVV